jgi:hypothetical protein
MSPLPERSAVCANATGPNVRGLHLHTCARKKYKSEMMQCYAACRLQDDCQLREASQRLRIPGPATFVLLAKFMTSMKLPLSLMRVACQ